MGASHVLHKVSRHYMNLAPNAAVSTYLVRVSAKRIKVSLCPGVRRGKVGSIVAHIAYGVLFQQKHGVQYLVLRVVKR